MSGPPSDRVDEVLEAVAHNRRRLALDCLRDHDELALADLAEEVTVRETGTPITEIAAEHVSDVYFSLYHNHVPTLEQVDLVSYHQERDLIVYERGADEALDRAREELAGIVDD